MRLFDTLGFGSQRLLARLTVIEASNVQRFMWSFGFPLPVKEWGARKCTPPFDAQFVEWKCANGRYGSLVERRKAIGGYSLDFRTRDDQLRSGSAFAVVSEDGCLDWDGIRYEGFAKWNHVLVPLLAFRLMHVGGARTIERGPSRHERRQAERDGRPPLTRYQVIEIGPKGRAGSSAPSGISRDCALHICRGHFADYTRGAGLFGKHKKEVFVPEHERGNPERGTTISDYRV